MKNPPPHICVINVFFAPYSYGGATIVAEELAKSLVRDHGQRVTAISAHSRGDLAPYSVMRVEKDGIQNYLINLPYGRSYAQLYDNPEVSAVMVQLLAQIDPDLVHLHCLQDLGAGLIAAAKELSLPVVLSVHDFWWICERQFMINRAGVYCGQNPVKIEACRGCVDDWERARSRSVTLQQMATQADLITYPSQFALELGTKSGVKGRKNLVLENGVHGPGAGFAAKAAARRARDPRLVFGYVGGPSQIKGWPLMRRAFEGLERDDFSGILVDGSLDNSWYKDSPHKAMKGDWRIAPRFNQAGLDDFYAQIDVLLFLSQWKETFGLTIREALARGITVIQTDSGGTVEYEGADPDQMLKIGAGPEVLKQHLNRVLDASERGQNPLKVTSFQDQAAEFIRLVAPLARPGEQPPQEQDPGPLHPPIG